MRAAYELGWVAASCFMGQDNAEFIYVDEIQFVKVGQSLEHYLPLTGLICEIVLFCSL